MIEHQQFAATLLRLRERAGFSRREVAAWMYCSGETLRRYELALGGPPHPRAVRDLLGLYGVTGAECDQLVQAARDLRSGERS